MPQQVDKIVQRARTTPQPLARQRLYSRGNTPPVPISPINATVTRGFDRSSGSTTLSSTSPAGLRRAAGRAVLRRRRRVVRGAPRRPDRRTLQAIVDRHLGDPFFGIFLNPGHQLHLDEWVNSPIGPGSTVELRSGMTLQSDIIPATGTDYFTTNVEDGVALADATLRDALRARYPGRGPGSRHAARSWPMSSGSTSTPTSCRSRTCRPASRRSCSGRTG